MPWTQDPSAPAATDNRAVGLVPFGTSGAISAPFEGHTAIAYDAVANAFNYIALPDYVSAGPGQTQGYPFITSASANGDSYIASTVGPLVYIDPFGRTTDLGWPTVGAGVYCTGVTSDGTNSAYAMFTDGTLAIYNSGVWTSVAPLPFGKDGSLTAISWDTTNTLVGAADAIAALYSGAATGWSNFTGADWFTALPAPFTTATTGFSALVTGYWFFPKDGLYKIGINNADGTLLYIDGVFATGLHTSSAGSTYTQDVYVRGGWRQVDIYYQQGGTAAALQVFWGGAPGAAATQLVDASVLRQSSPGTPTYNSGLVYVPIDNTGLMYIYDTGSTPGWSAHYPSTGTIGKISAPYETGTSYHLVHSEDTYSIPNTAGLYSAVSPDGLWAASSDPTGGAVSIYDMTLNASVSFALPGALTPEFTPDSLQLLVPTGNSVKVYTLNTGTWIDAQTITESVTAITSFYLPGTQSITAFFATADTLTRWISFSQVWSVATPVLAVTGAIDMTFMPGSSILFAYTSTSVIPIPYDTVLQTWAAGTPVTGFAQSIVDISHDATGVVVADEPDPISLKGNLYYLTALSGSWAITSQVAMPDIAGAPFTATGLTSNNDGAVVFAYGTVAVGGMETYAISYTFDALGNIRPPRQYILTWGNALVVSAAGKPAYAMGKLALPSPAGLAVLENKGNEFYGFIRQPMAYTVDATGFSTGTTLPADHSYTALSIDSNSGNLWLTDTNRNQIVEADSTGKLLKAITVPQPYATVPANVVLGLSGIVAIGTYVYASAALSVTNGAVFSELQ